MDRILFGMALLLGAFALFWTGTAFLGTNAPAFAVVGIIGCVYGIGIVELLKFRQGTKTLSRALSIEEGADLKLDAWLERLDPAIRSAVRQRIEGDRTGLPAPVMTPYLTGLLVMLGLLGTFVGLVDTLGGAVNALEGTTELQAIRQGLTAPIKGLGLAFGTSVAGVATSAMLGLMSTLSRRSRILETRRLDRRLVKDFQPFSLTHQQKQTFAALQQQTRALPDVVQKLDGLTTSLARLSETLIDHQKRHRSSAEENYAQLAASVDRSLQHYLSENIRRTGEMIQPLARETMGRIGDEAKGICRHFFKIATKTLDQSVNRTEGHMLDVAATVKAGLESHNRANGELIGTLQQSVQTVVEQSSQAARSVEASFQQRLHSWLADQQENDQKRLALWTQGLDETQAKATENLFNIQSAFVEEQKAVANRQLASMSETKDHFAALSSSMASDVDALGRSLEIPLKELLEKADRTHGALGETMARIEQVSTKRIQRDNQLLQEQHRIMERVHTQAISLAETTQQQSDTVDQLLETSQRMLEATGERFGRLLDQKGGHLSSIADTFAVSTAEMGSLGDAFTTAVDLFHQSNQHLMENLSGIEAALDQVAKRSDEQLNYYVAQAREIIDHCLLSQKEVFTELSRFQPAKETDLEEAGKWRS